MLQPCTRPLMLAAIMLMIAVAARAQNPQAASVRFMENRGQIVDAEKHSRPDILFVARSKAGSLYLRRTGVSYVFASIEHDSSSLATPMASWQPRGPDTSQRVTTYRMDMELVGANAAAQVEKTSQSMDYANYYLAHCPQGITNVRSYERVVYRDIYPHIDLVYYSNDGGLKYDFVVHPGGNVSDIRLRYVGADRVECAVDGSVSVGSPMGTVVEGRPMVYSGHDDAASKRRSVTARYRVQDSTIAFDVAPYDHALTLIIDPTILWSTFFGGSGGDNGLSANNSNGLCRGRDTTLLVTFASVSLDFPTTPGVAQTTKNGGAGMADAIIACFSNRGARLWATYFGGAQSEGGTCIGVDDLNYCYVGGYSTSTDLPVTPGAFQSTPAANALENGFIMKLDDAGRLVWASYIRETFPFCLSVDRRRNFVVGGWAFHDMVATPGAFQTTPPPAGTSKGFLSRFTGNCTQLWCSFFGGMPVPGDNLAEITYAVALDGDCNIYTGGASGHTDYPIVGNAAQPVKAALIDATLAKLDSNGIPIWSTFYGGGARETTTSVALDSHGNFIAAGNTTSDDFPVTPGAFQVARANTSVFRDCFLAKFDTAGNRIWSTYVSGTAEEQAPSVAVDARGSIWFGTSGTSQDFPVTPDGFQLGNAGSLDGNLLKFDPSGALRWATMLGGSAFEFLQGVATTQLGVVVTGGTLSTNFPLAGTPFQTALNGPNDVFLTSFCDPVPLIDTNGRATRFCQGDSVVLSLPPGFDSYHWSTGATTRSIAVRTSGLYSVVAGITGCSGNSDTVRVVVYPTPQRTLRPAGPIVLCEGDSATLQFNAPATAYRWSTGETTATIKVKTGGRYSAFFVDSNGCTNYTDTVVVRISARPQTTITAVGPVSVCEGGSVTLDAGAGFSSYFWNSGETTQRIAVGKAGTYSVRVMNADGCLGPVSNAITVTIYPAPPIGIRNVLPTTFCEGDSTILVASPSTYASYVWSNGATTPVITIRKEGTYTLVVTDTNGCTATARVTTSVKPGPHPKLAVSGPTRFCRGDSMILSANGFLQYQWSNGSNGSSIVVKDPGKYFVTVMNDGGCYGTSDTVTIEVMPLPSVAISGPIRVCPSTLANYGAPAAPRMQYAWTVPSGGAITAGAGTNAVTVQWAAAGTGVLRLHAVSDSTGCSADTSITVVIGSSLVPVVTANRSLRLCTGDSVTLDAGAYATYQWSTGETSRTITVGAAGKYTVSVADAKGCAGTSDPVEVTLNTPPQPAITMPNGGMFCAGDSIVLDAGAGYAKYLWSNGFTSQRITLRATSRVSVTVTDTNGCTGTSAEVQVTSSPQTPPTVNGPVQVCQNSTVTYSTPATAGSTYQWAVTGGIVLSGQGSASVRIQWGAAGAGRIDLVETTSLGCTGTSPGLDVTIGDHLVPTITPRGSIALCPGSTVHLDAGAGYASYQWSTGEKTQSIDVTSAGSYTVTVADSSGCSGTSDTVNVFAKTAPVPAISGGPLEFCEGGSVTLTADAGYMSYLWSTGVTTPSVTVTSAGSYTVAVTDIDGCTGTSKPVNVVVDPLPAKPVITLVGDQLTSTPAVKYQWLRDGAAIAGATSQTIQATANGMYRVIVQNQFGCASVSDPMPYRVGAGPRLVMLDTISARVGERRYLTMRVLPPLTAADAVHAYHAELRYDPRALFIHDVVSPDRATTGDPAMHLTDVTGLLTVDRPATSPVLIGDELLRVELEGLVTGQPLDVMTIERMAMPEVSGVSVAGSGLVILSGCEIGTAFAKVVRIDAIRPNPARDEMIVRYRLPAGKVGELRLSDAAGREVARTITPAGTGSFEELRVDLAHVSSGVYMIELRDGAERSAVPAVIAK